MKTQIVSWLVVMLASTPLGLRAVAEESPSPLDLRYLEKQAAERVTITLDKQMLDFAAKFLPKKDPDAEKVRALVKDLDAISVRNLEFDHAGAYSASDLEKIRQQLAGPGWSRMVEVRGKENVDFFVKKDGDKIQGFTIISAEPKQLTVVSIQGNIRPEQLSDLEGFAGIPEGIWKSGEKAEKRSKGVGKEGKE